MMLMDEAMALDKMNVPISNYTEWHLLLGAKQTRLLVSWAYGGAPL